MKDDLRRLLQAAFVPEGLTETTAACRKALQSLYDGLIEKAREKMYQFIAVPSRANGTKKYH